MSGAISVGLPRGRSLKFGPCWSCSDAVILFDCHSGDYWVVSDLGFKLLRLLLTHAEMTHDALAMQLAPDLAHEENPAMLQLTMQSLMDNGLLQAVH